MCQSQTEQQRKKKGIKASTADGNDTDYEALFTCPEEECIKAYQKYSYLERHLDFGKHQYSVERESFFDKAMVMYAEKLESGESSVEGKTASNLTNQTTQVGVVLSPMGWALKGGATGRRRFTDKKKKYLIDLFITGEQT